MAIGMDLEKPRRIVRNGACGIAAALALATHMPAAGQQPDSTLGAQELNTALDALSHAPNDVSALLRAGWASFNLGDTQAALGFFRRAEQTAPANGAAKAGEASALLRLDDPVNAVKLFAAAEAAGAPMAQYAGDRGLALDLVGENVAAQRYYQQALAQKYDPEVVRRLSLSQAISGDQRASEATLLPLLQRQDLTSYRTRAFALAILGKGEDAVSIAEKMLPADLSSRMAPYLRYMPRLTRAQQAAAANLGKFPPPSEIGRDDPQIAVLSGQNPAPSIAANTPDARLVPSGQALGTSDRSNDDRRQRRGKSDKAKDKKASGHISVTYAPLPQPAGQSAAAQPSPAPQTAEQATRALPPPAELPPSPEQSASQPVVVARLDSQAAPAPTPSPPVDQAPRPSLSVSAPTRVRAATNPVSLADAFAEFTNAAPPASSAPDAVDITKIKPIRIAPKPPPKPVAKPKSPANPSRVWVQVGTGRNVNALAFTWRKVSKKGGALLGRHDAYSAKWGRTRRLVTGPYKSEDEAQAAIRALKKKGINSFEFVSDEGEEVTPLE